MNNEILERIEQLNKLNLLISNTTSAFKFELYKLQEQLEQELNYLLVIEKSNLDFKIDDQEENYIDMEQLKNNKHPDNIYTTEQQQKHYFTKS
ncbi:hypothetical protein [Methylotenera sp. 1P/1]|uniref:hypothetical protein n=1 Tax=Methylotenera sp. 1P/1 TaxID=1131551 RepID=UPI00035CBF0A|nr:hypothetical protein [Methylotenera sp. 1P/1]